MFICLLKSIILGIGLPDVLLDAALPGPMDVISENYPIIILALVVVIALIVILVSRHRRRKREKNDANSTGGPESSR